MRDTYPMIWNVVAQIPRGSVATYGQVAEQAGLPGNARLVGYALHALPRASNIPWHRVINSRGEISFPKQTSMFRKQQRLLKDEGVLCVNGKIDLAKYGWFERMQRKWQAGKMIIR